MPSSEAWGSAVATSSTSSALVTAGMCRSRAILPRPTTARRRTVTALFAPSQHQGIETTRDLNQPCPNRGMQRLQRQTHGFVPDDAAFLHQHLGGGEPALAIHVIDQRQPPLIGLDRFVAPAGEERVHDLANAVGI